MPLVAMPLLRLGLRRGQVDRISESDFRHLVSGAGAGLPRDIGTSCIGIIAGQTRSYNDLQFRAGPMRPVEPKLKSCHA